MTRTLKNKNLAANVASLAAILFVFLFGATSCADRDFLPGTEPEPPVISGDTIISFNDFKLHEKAWTYSNGLATAKDHYFDGYVEYKVNGKVVKTDLIEHETAAMSIEWAPVKEDTAATAEKMYLESIAGEAKFVKNHVNQKVNFDKYERECILKFVGMEITLKGTWYEASLGNSKVVGCRYEKTTISTQDPDTAMVNGVKEEIEINGKKYNRVKMTAKAENHFIDLPSEKPHTEAMDIVYSVLVPVNFVPGEKIYQGSSSVEGTGIYTKVSDTEYKSQIDLTHYFSQDGKTSTEQETVSGTAIVRTWVEGDNTPKIWSSSQIGNPAVSVNESTSELYQKDGYIYAKMYKTVWTYTWSDANTGESFRKEVHSEVERLYYRREAGKEVAMPYGETTTSYAGFNAGAAVIKTQNGKEYESYSGQISFNGNHKSTTGNVNDAISGLVAPQEIWVEVVKEEDKFIDFDYKVIKGDKDKDAQIIITEHWSVSGDKTLTFSQSANYSFTVSGQQRVFGESLSFANGPAKSTNNSDFVEVKEGQFVRTVTTVTSVNFIPTCEVKATASENEAYLEYRGKRINFEFAKAEVSYEGINNPTATEVSVDGKLYSRKAYEVSFAHSVLGEKVASVLVDKEVILDPTTPDEWGRLDIEKTKNFGGLSWSWKNVGGKLVPFVSGTIVTEYGVVSFWEGGNNFTKMNTNTITDRLSNSIKSEGPEYLIPAYIRILTDPNKHWGYQDVNGQYRDEINGVDIEMLKDVSIDKPFIAEGGEANVYEISNGRVIVTYQGKVLFNEVFAK